MWLSGLLSCLSLSFEPSYTSLLCQPWQRTNVPQLNGCLLNQKPNYMQLPREKNTRNIQKVAVNMTKKQLSRWRWRFVYTLQQISDSKDGKEALNEGERGKNLRQKIELIRDWVKKLRKQTKNKMDASISYLFGNCYIYIDISCRQRIRKRFLRSNIWFKWKK